MTQKTRVRMKPRKSHLDFANDAVAVYEGLMENPALPPTTPVPLVDFKATVDAYTRSISAAADGSRKAKAERDKLREDVEKMWRQFGHWVQLHCQDDPGIVRSSGFHVTSTTRVAPGQASPPVILKTSNGKVSGQITLTVTKVQRARNYEVRYAANSLGEKPESWVVLPSTSTRISVSGLRPGASYVFQVRAFGTGGLTDWSDAANRIAI